jgi:hypothetical protein
LLAKEGKKPPYKYKTWKKDANKSKNYTKKKLNALVKKLVSKEKKIWEKKQGDSTRMRKSMLLRSARTQPLIVMWLVVTNKPVSEQVDEVGTLLASMDLELDDKEINV